MESNEKQFQRVRYGTNCLVWVCLLLLTATTVTVTKMQLGKMGTVTALVIASFKASLVLYFFMHLKYEKRIFKLMFFMPVVTLTIIIGLTFLDIWYR